MPIPIRIFSANEGEQSIAPISGPDAIEQSFDNIIKTLDPGQSDGGVGLDNVKAEILAAGNHSFDKTNCTVIDSVTIQGALEELDNLLKSAYELSDNLELLEARNSSAFSHVFSNLDARLEYGESTTLENLSTLNSAKTSTVYSTTYALFGDRLNAIEAKILALETLTTEINARLFLGV